MWKAVDIYTKDLPAYYNRQIHETKLKQATTLYHSLAHGPSAEDFAGRMTQECERIWKTGRQRCEAVSLSGRECVLGSDHDKSDQPKGPKSTRAAGVVSSKHSSTMSVEIYCNCGKTRLKREDPFEFETANIGNFNSPCCHLGTTVIPDVSSFWSFLKIGDAKWYNWNGGLECRDGFFPRTHYLLPWYLRSAIASSNVERVEETRNRRGRQRSRIQPDDGFIGFEFACPLGHRFLSIRNGRACKAHRESVREHANFTLGFDMPLFSPCLCGAGAIAQLMRLWIVVPDVEFVKNPVVNPVVKLYIPASGDPLSPAATSTSSPTPPPTSHTFLLSSVPLELKPNSTYVIRLPYIYDINGSPAQFPESLSGKMKSVLCRDFVTFEGIATEKRSESGTGAASGTGKRA
ncbi:Smg8/Smg9 [Paraphysoderma sedebokerense]|nr:Smg8/Smg9 [Paraphysoderma sedebokerense]